MSRNILQRLNANGEEFVKALRKKNAEQGLRSLLTKLYPDNAHFIYELLQNAEDAKATRVKFKLEEDKLVFVHNGNRLFTEKDIEAITNIGVGTKKDDVNSIGEFGVGFKAVFAYTELPKIYSGEYNFEIKSLYVPREIPPIEKKDSETVFIFPFNNKNKPQAQAYKEINDSLNNINRTTLLFLSSISKIEIKISDESNTISKHTDKISKISTITNTKLNKQTNFLVFSKPLSNEEKLYVSIAFKLTKDKKTKREKIVIDNDAKVSIFFPAEKETSNLKFHIHAPFASTVARDSITDQKQNDELIELIADLLCEATEWMKGNGFLNDNFIRCLPIDDDNLNDFYKPIQSRIIDLFNTAPFLLCDDNEYHPAKDCWQSTKRLKTVISTQNLKVLLKGKINGDCFWVTRPFQKNASGRLYNFLKSLMLNTYSEDDFQKSILSLAEHFNENPYDIKKELKEWKENNGWYNRELSAEIETILNSKLDNEGIVIRLFNFIEEELVTAYSFSRDYSRKIENIVKANYSQIVINELLLDKDNDWLKSFYELLYNILDVDDYEDDDDYYDDYYDQDSEYKDLRLFVRLKDEKYNFSKSECYFPSRTSINSIRSFIVSTETYDDSIGKKKASKSKRFLKNVLGVKEIAIDDEVNHILKKYENDAEIEHNDNIEHLKLFFKYYKENKSNFDKKLFENTPFLINSDNEQTKPTRILIDEPIEQTSLAKLSNKRYKALHSVYFEPKSNVSIKKFREFIMSVGCNISLPIEKKYDDNRIKEKLGNNERKTDYGKNENYYLPIPRPFTKPKIKTSAIVWNEISKLKDVSCFDAIYQANGSSETRTCDSDVIETLKENAWIPNTKGEFYKPEDITEDSLHQDFEFNNQNGWLTRIGLGQNAVKNQKLESVKDDLKEHTGYDLSTLEEAKKVGVTEDDFKQLIEEKKQKSIDLKGGIENHNREIDNNNSQPSPSIVSNTEKYREKAQQQLYKNISRFENKNKSYIYSKKVKVGKNEIRDFLKKQYQGYCQICGFTFSQSGSKGNYFEMFDWLSEIISKQESDILAGTSLSLCSRCHSILKHGDFGADFLDSIQNIEKTDYKEFAEYFDLIVEDEDIPEVFDFIEMDMYKLPIRKLNKEEYIFFSEEHFIHFHLVLTLNKDNQEEDKEVKKIEILNNVEPTNNIECELSRVVDIGDVISVKNSSGKKPLKLKLVSIAQNINNKDGISRISASSPFGKKVKGQPEGYIFEMGIYIYEIINIE